MPSNKMYAHTIWALAFEMRKIEKGEKKLQQQQKKTNPKLLLKLFQDL